MNIIMVYSDELVAQSVAAVSAVHAITMVKAGESADIDFTNYSLVLLNVDDILCDRLLDKINKKIPVLRLNNSNQFIKMMNYVTKGLVGTVSLPLSGAFLYEIIDSLSRQVVILPENSNDKYQFYYNGDKIEVCVNPDFLLRSVRIAEQDIEQKKIAVTHITSNKKVDAASVNDSLSRLQEEVVEGLINDEFSLAYQPVHYLNDQMLYGFEALIRWNRKGLLISPDDFIPLVEKTDVVYALNDWVLNQVLLDLEDWNVKFTTNGDNLRVNINLSAHLFESPGIADKIIESVKTAKIDPRQLGLELTESAFMDSKEIANLALLKLKSNNFPIYMDDFGTGYSSLSYLQHFPVDILKIDKSFVKWITFDEDSEHIVSSIIGLAHGLKMKVVGEGVEERAQVDFLRERGCEFGQGFFFSRPLKKNDASLYLADYHNRR
ncbi:MAG: EAL domain-containing protein [Spirochaetes bacterium]|nr:EAL domain-containing protein [Spirochaetota bacterium]MBN2770428.1 EAL domain-containing protein [Spirochaetota bacterium]